MIIPVCILCGCFCAPGPGEELPQSPYDLHNLKSLFFDLYGCYMYYILYIEALQNDVMMFVLISYVYNI